MDNEILIYAIDDEPSIRELIKEVVKAANYECESMSSYAELKVALQKRIPDIILLDVMLENIDGFEILSIIKGEERTKDIPVIMVSAKGDEISKVKGLNLGANDYISKPFGVMELIARIKANLRKKVEKKLIYKDIEIVDSKREVFVDEEKLTLTKKEYDLIKLFVERQNTVITRDEILNIVWGQDYFGETRTLDMHVKELRKKIANSQCKIENVRGVGYILI